MIKITYNPHNHLIVLKGHAEGYDELKNKLICSSVSTVFYNFCAMLREYPPEAFSIPFAMKEAKSMNGTSSVRAVPSNGYETLINHDFYYAMVGFETIAGNFPNAVQIVIKQ